MNEPIPDLLTLKELADASVLPRGFYQRPTAEVARDLLGKVLVRESADGVVAIRLTEVEAYLGIDDPACHTFGGRRTARTETMWGEAGRAYIYLIYGIHHCLNVVTVGEGVPEAVLIRGGVPVTGGRLIRLRRGSKVPRRNLVDGPGKLCQAMALTRSEDSLDFCDPASAFTIRADGRDIPNERVERLPRVGVDYAGKAAAWPLRLMADLRSR
jgi:DNA-3-methyladenine glycosylase